MEKRNKESLLEKIKGFSPKSYEYLSRASVEEIEALLRGSEGKLKSVKEMVELMDQNEDLLRAGNSLRKRLKRQFIATICSFPVAIVLAALAAMAAELFGRDQVYTEGLSFLLQKLGKENFNAFFAFLFYFCLFSFSLSFLVSLGTLYLRGFFLKKRKKKQSPLLKNILRFFSPATSYSKKATRVRVEDIKETLRDRLDLSYSPSEIGIALSEGGFEKGRLPDNKRCVFVRKKN